MDGGPPIDVQNVVATSNLRCELALDAVALDLTHGELTSEFSAIRYSSPDHPTTVLIYSSGKVLSTGADSPTEAKQSLHSLRETLADLGAPVADDLEISIENIVATVDYNERLSLEAIAIGLGLEDIEYDPDTFPALFYRDQQRDIAFLIFTSGKINVTGAKSVEQAQQAATDLLAQLDQFETDPMKLEVDTSRLEALIDQYCDELGVGEDVRDAAYDILRQCSDRGVGLGRSHTVRSGAAVYLAGKRTDSAITQNELAAVADISPVSIRNLYSEYEEALVEGVGSDPQPAATADDPQLPFDVEQRDEFTEAEIAAILRFVALQAERAPRVKDINSYTVVTLSDITQHFESLETARVGAGVSDEVPVETPLWEQESPTLEVDPDEIHQRLDSSDSHQRLDSGDSPLSHPYSESTIANPDRETLLDEIDRLADELGSRPTRADIERESPFTVEDFEAVFETWTTAVEEAGYTVTRGRSESVSRDELIDYLREVAETVDRRPKIADLNEHGSISAQSIYKYFDGLGDALEAADVADGPEE